MRWVCLVVVVALAGLGQADPIRGKRLRDQARSGATQAERETAASEIAVLVGKRQELAIDDARHLVISDDPKIRGPLIHALIDAELLARAIAAHVPTAKALTSQLPKLLARTKLRLVPVASDCRVTGGTVRFATLECHARRCGGNCRNETTALTVTTGKRWAISDVQQVSNEDGSCGHCMLIE